MHWGNALKKKTEAKGENRGLRQNVNISFSQVRYCSSVLQSVPMDMSWLFFSFLTWTVYAYAWARRHRLDVRHFIIFNLWLARKHKPYGHRLSVYAASPERWWTILERGDTWWAVRLRITSGAPLRKRGSTSFTAPPPHQLFTQPARETETVRGRGLARARRRDEEWGERQSVDTVGTRQLQGHGERGVGSDCQPLPGQRCWITSVVSLTTMEAV